MAWIEVHQSLLTHRKTLRLARLLSLDRYAVVGRLVALWQWSLDNAPDGTFREIEPDILADVMGWDGKPAELVDALLTAGFVDLTDGVWAIHDWADYAGKLIEQRQANADRVRRYRERQSGPKAPDPSSNAHVTVTTPLRNGENMRYRTLPNSTVQNQRENAQARADDAPARATSLSLVAAQEVTPDSPAPVDPDAERRSDQGLFEAWVKATGRTPGKGERRAWVASLVEMRGDYGLSPPDCFRLVAQYRARFGAERCPTPGQVAAQYSQLTGDPNGHGAARRTHRDAERSADAETRRAAKLAALAREGVALPPGAQNGAHPA